MKAASALMTERGFTLIELMVTVGVVAILAAVAIPSFSSMIQNGRQSSVYNGLISELNYARSEAVKRSTSVVVCARADDTSCATTAQWDDGWLVFVDTNRDGTIGAGEDILRVGESVSDKQTVIAEAFSNTAAVTYLGRGNTDSIGHFVICDDRGAEYAKAVNIVLTGAIRKAVDSNGNNVVEDMSGADVSCPSS